MGEKYSSLGREFYFDIDSDIIRLGKQTMRKHCHNHFEIYYITKGNCCYFIENKAYHLVPGDIILIPEGIMHGTEYQKTIYSRKLISCSDYFIPDSVKPILPSLMHLYRNPDIVPEIDRIFDMIEEEYTRIDGMSEFSHKQKFFMLTVGDTAVQRLRGDYSRSLLATYSIN